MRCGLCLWGRGVQTFQLVMIPRFHGAGVLFSSCAEGWTLSRIISILFVSSRAVSFGSGSCFLSLLFSLVCEYGSEQCVVLISH